MTPSIFVFMLILLGVYVSQILGRDAEIGLTTARGIASQRDLKNSDSNFKSVNIVGFWNIFAGGSHYQTIVDEQMHVLETSGLLSMTKVLYYTTMGQHREQLHLNSREDSSKVKHLKDFGEKGSELLTLNELYAHCQTVPTDIVYYFHNKGSLNYKRENTNFRRALDCFILNPACAYTVIPKLSTIKSPSSNNTVSSHGGSSMSRGNKPPTFDTCGWRLSPLPHMHYPGNYWWATCQHINRLIPPLSPMNNKTFLQYSAKLYDKRKYRNPQTTVVPSAKDAFPDQPYLGLGRYFAETWVTSLPFFRPSDCLNTSSNNRYLWGKVPLPWRLLQKRCPNFDLNFMSDAYSDKSKGWSPTGKHMVITDPRPSTPNIHSSRGSFIDVSSSNSSSRASGAGHDSDYASLSYGLPCGLAGMIAQPKRMKKRYVLGSFNFTPELYDRSLYWYGQPPRLHLAWLALFD